jgi:hypothetical protein
MFDVIALNPLPDPYTLARFFVRFETPIETADTDKPIDFSGRGGPTGELTGYIGITEAKLPKEFPLSNVVTFPKKTA